MCRLKNFTWLNDEVINAQLMDLYKRAKERNMKIHIFSTFFMSKLLEGEKYTYDNVRRWTS